MVLGLLILSSQPIKFKVNQDLRPRYQELYLWKTCKWLVKMWQIFSQLEFRHSKKKSWLFSKSWNALARNRLNHWNLMLKLLMKTKTKSYLKGLQTDFLIPGVFVQRTFWFKGGWFSCVESLLIPYKELMNPGSKQPDKLSVSFALKA